jgi:Ni,Fe-hydrogenase maturation factor
MNKSPTAVRVVGIGSPYGDDQAGWEVIALLRKVKLAKSIELLQAGVPHELLDWVDASSHLILIDAYQCDMDLRSNLCVDIACSAETGWDLRLKLNENCCQDCELKSGVVLKLESLKLESSSSHQIGIAETLRLLACLGKFPKSCRLWAIAGIHFSPRDSMSRRTAASVAHCAADIERELRSA